MQVSEKMQEYWSKNLRLTGVLLAIWFIVSYGVVYFAKPLSKISFLGFPFSFYMGAQGALVIFVAIIAFYAWRMNRLDREYNVHEE